MSLRAGRAAPPPTTGESPRIRSDPDPVLAMAADRPRISVTAWGGGSTAGESPPPPEARLASSLAGEVARLGVSGGRLQVPSAARPPTPGSRKLRYVVASSKRHKIDQDEISSFYGGHF